MTTFFIALISKRRMPLFRSDHPSDPRTIVYLQNSGRWNGFQFGSTILSCKPKRDEVMAYLAQAHRFIASRYTEHPIRWHDMMTNRLLGPESVDGEMIGNFFRENCILLDDVVFHGGHIFGGKTGDKYLEKPEFRADQIPSDMPREVPMLMAICGMKGSRHECTIEPRKSSINDIRKYQKIMANVMVSHEINYWENQPQRRRQEILTELAKIRQDLSV